MIDFLLLLEIDSKFTQNANKLFIFFITAANSKTLKVLLSFAVGGLLGDVFLHLLPEAWEGDVNKAGSDRKLSPFSVFITLILFNPLTNT